MSARPTAAERAEQRAAERAAWIAARLAEAPPLNPMQQHVIRRAFAGSTLRRTTRKASAA